MTQQDLLQRAFKEILENETLVSNDPYRLQYHLMAPVGLINDPNGLIQFNGVYHVFYQWNPFETSHGAKFWGHYTSKDLVHWVLQPPALVPCEWYEKNGCYSGSAVEDEGKLYLFYTGNLKNEDGERVSHQCIAVSKDGIHFDKKGPFISVPKGYTPHFRDPKVWKSNDIWYMVIGAQTERKEGQAVLFSSKNMIDWQFKGPMAGSNMNGLGDLGYMWECPDLFNLGNRDVLLVSPQGIEAQGYHYQNLFQSGYFIGEWNPETNVYQHGDFTELDRGFDFYAPQTFEDENGRRILFAWMGITDEQESYQPTIANGWIHALTLPRELQLIGDKLYQKPAAELRRLRKSRDVDEQVSLYDSEESWFELSASVSEKINVEFHQIDADEVEIAIRDNLKLRYQQKEQLFTLERKSFMDRAPESRSCELTSLEKLQIFLDSSSVEIFLNEGQEVFTSRFFADPYHQKVKFTANGKVNATIQKWDLLSFSLVTELKKD
ncbi:glycoside hydrolase family 32 protein [Niallia sp. Krafla_26]|uniref:glycoside hydrolase family 32 protein n=1 Tax=Niallia sp. Krafla_26 TaxID=3064703 RepID=UPI003D167332